MKIRRQNFMAIISVMFLFFINISPAQAATVYYTFEGYIDNFGSDPVGEAESIGLGLKEPVSYTLEVNFSGIGSRTFSGGTSEAFTDTSGTFYGDNYTTDYFYTSLTSSSHLALSPRIYASYNDSIDWSLGSSVSWSNNTASGKLNVGSSLIIQSQHRTVQNWTIGESLISFYHFGDETAGTDGVFTSSLTLTSINTTVVPLPTSLWLFGSGLIGLIGFSKRRYF